MNINMAWSNLCGDAFKYLLRPGSSGPVFQTPCRHQHWTFNLSKIQIYIYIYIYTLLLAGSFWCDWSVCMENTQATMQPSQRSVFTKCHTQCTFHLRGIGIGNHQVQSLWPTPKQSKRKYILGYTTPTCSWTSADESRCTDAPLKNLHGHIWTVS